MEEKILSVVSLIIDNTVEAMTDTVNGKPDTQQDNPALNFLKGHSDELVRYHAIKYVINYRHRVLVSEENLNKSMKLIKYFMDNGSYVEPENRVGIPEYFSHGDVFGE